MSATLDGQLLPALVGITAESCYDGYRGYSLTFTAEADSIHEAIDDELRLSLNIQIDDLQQNWIGRSMDVAKNNHIHLTAGSLAFLAPPQESLTTATGTLNIASLSPRDNWISLTFIYRFSGCYPSGAGFVNLRSEVQKSGYYPLL